jgi:hypothetical protein
LARPQEVDLPALQYSLQKGQARPQQPPQLLLRKVPETLQLALSGVDFEHGRNLLPGCVNAERFY